MILCAALLFSAVATGVLILFAVRDWISLHGLESVDEFKQTMDAIGPRRWS